MIHPRRFLLCLASLSLSACGLSVPQIGEIWDDDTGASARTLETKIKEKIFCELNAAVASINFDNDKRISVVGPDPRHPGKQIEEFRKPVPETWGATLTLTFTVEEASGLNPGVTFNTPIIPGQVFFPGGVSTNPLGQSYGLGVGGTLSSTATRTDKFTFFYKVTDLEHDTPECRRADLDHGGHAPGDAHGSSLLLESNLGIYKWLDNMAQMRSSIGVSRKSSEQVYTYDVKFDILSSGGVTPTWSLVRVSTGNAGLPLFGTKRERTHEMLLTFGPLEEGPGGQQQPSRLTANDALAAQIGSAVGAAVTKALSR